MHLGRVLVEPGRHLVFGLFHGHSVDVVDFFAGFVVGPAERRAGEIVFPVHGIKQRDGVAEGLRIDGGGQVRHNSIGRVGLPHRASSP
jgi:hypothetical protein